MACAQHGHTCFIEPEDGWETGRPSEPAFMDLNLHATRDDKYVPKAVVWQYDARRPLNPRGLLVALGGAAAYIDRKRGHTTTEGPQNHNQ